MTLDPDEIRSKFKSALYKFLQCDLVLLEINVNERTITHKLAEHLQQEFPGYDVDCEYNRHINERKKLPIPPHNFKGPDLWHDTGAKTVYPDIVVHRRMSDENLLVIEAKKSSSKDDPDWDKAKLKAFKGENYNYRMAIFVSFRVGKTSGERFHFEEVA